MPFHGWLLTILLATYVFPGLAVELCGCSIEIIEQLLILITAAPLLLFPLLALQKWHTLRLPLKQLPLDDAPELTAATPPCFLLAASLLPEHLLVAELRYTLEEVDIRLLVVGVLLAGASIVVVGELPGHVFALVLALVLVVDLEWQMAGWFVIVIHRLRL